MADIIICETKIRRSKFYKLRNLLNQMKIGSRLLTYEDLNCIYNDTCSECPFKSINRYDDRFSTSWAPMHLFFLYIKVK